MLTSRNFVKVAAPFVMFSILFAGPAVADWTDSLKNQDFLKKAANILKSQTNGNTVTAPQNSQASSNDSLSGRSAGSSQKNSAPTGTVVPNILGIQIGMTPEQVGSALRSFDPKIQITQIPEYFRMTAVTAVNEISDQIEITLSPLPSPPVVLSVSRRNSSSKPIAISSVLDSLEEKYGKPKEVWGGRYFWFFDRLNKPVPAPAVASRSNGLYCMVTGKTLPEVVSNYELAMGPGVSKDNWEDYVGIKKSCGTVLEVNIGVGNNPKLTNNVGLAGGFRMQIIDNPAYLRAVQDGIKYSSDQHRKQNERDLEKAKRSNQPAL